MSMPLQAKLLRVIQDGVVRRVGSEQQDAVVDVRFISATNREPQEAVERASPGRPVLPVARGADQAAAAAQAAGGHSAARQSLPDLLLAAPPPDGRPVPRLSEASIAFLRSRPWRGNVRELQNVIEHVAVLAEPDQIIQPNDIPVYDDGSEWPAESVGARRGHGRGVSSGQGPGGRAVREGVPDSPDQPSGREHVQGGAPREHRPDDAIPVDGQARIPARRQPRDRRRDAGDAPARLVERRAPPGRAGATAAGPRLGSRTARPAARSRPRSGMRCGTRCSGPRPNGSGWSSTPPGPKRPRPTWPSSVPRSGRRLPATTADLGSVPRNALSRRLLGLDPQRLRRARARSCRRPTRASCCGCFSAIEAVAEQLEADWSQHFTDRLSAPDGLELVVEVAHDLRSPLTSILFLAETLQRGRSGPVNPVQERQLGLIYSAAFGLSSVASDVIELARGGDRLVDLDPIPFSVKRHPGVGARHRSADCRGEEPARCGSRRPRPISASVIRWR